MKKFVKVFLILAILGGGVLSRVNAAEVFMLLSYDGFSRVYRVVTDDTLFKPIGYHFEASEAVGFYIDAYKDFRLLEINAVDDLPGKISATLFRQVFDGSIQEADNGINGDKTHNDERESLIAGSKGKPVYRCVGAPLSKGPGRKINLRLNERDFVAGECRIVDGKNWYQIPNDSWYQTWHHATESKDSGRLIFYDCWQAKKQRVVESIWRGQTPGRVAAGKITDLEERQLLRAICDGALRIVPYQNEAQIVARSSDRFSFYFDAGRLLSRGRLVFYTWNGDKKGRFHYTNVRHATPTAFESLSSDARFVGLGEQKVMVMGSDILADWLKESGIDHEGASADLAAFFHESLTLVTEIAVYDRAAQTLYRCRYDEQKEALVEPLTPIKLAIAPEKMLYDSAGNLLLTLIEEKKPTTAIAAEPDFDLETMIIETGGIVSEFSEDEGLYTKQIIPDQVVGRFIFSRGYSQSLYAIAAGSSTVEHVCAIDLNKEFFMREFELNAAPDNLLNLSYNEVYLLAKEQQNHLSPLKSEVDGYPDQFVKPKDVFIGYYQR
jgi:hypothetical protein